MRVHQSSIMAQGWGTGNCFYLGVEADGTDTARGKHRFQCQNVGALAKSANLQLAFQFTISKVGKGMDLAGTAATNGIVTGVVPLLYVNLRSVLIKPLLPLLLLLSLMNFGIKPKLMSLLIHQTPLNINLSWVWSKISLQLVCPVILMVSKLEILLSLSTSSFSLLELIKLVLKLLIKEFSHLLLLLLLILEVI